MISTTSTFNQALLANNRMWKLKVEVKRNDAGALTIDITDRVKSADISFDWERRSATASLSLDNFDFTLSPLNRTSPTNQVGGVYNPLLDAYHEINIYYELLTSVGYERIQRFTGVLGDEIDADSFPGIVNITARDKSKYLQDTYIYQSKTYQGLVIEQVIQDMLNEFSPIPITLQVANPTLFMVGRPDKPFTAKDTNLWDSIQSLADVCNHELRFTESGTLTLKKIERDLYKASPSITFSENDLVKDSISVSDADVRNHIMLRVQGLNPIEKKNEDSIAKYGRRYMEVHRSLANIITTQEQGHELVDTFLKDLSYATPKDSAEMPLYPVIQIGDIVCIENEKTGTDPIFDVFRVVRIRDSFSATSKRTQIELQGYVRFDPATLPVPNPPTNLRYTMQERTIQNYENSGWSGNEKTIYFPRIEWDAPTQDVSGNVLPTNFGGYTVLRKSGASGNLVPIASVKSYIDALNLKVQYFYDYTASGGATHSYYVRAVGMYGGKSVDSVKLDVPVPATVIK